MSAHRWWRIKANSIHSGTWLVVAEIELRATSGGADLTDTSAGTALESGGGNPAKAFDNDINTDYNILSGVVPGWMGWEFTAGEGAQTVREIVLSSGTGGAQNNMPSDFDVEYSDNGSDWITINSFPSEASWSIQESRTYTLSLGNSTTVTVVDAAKATSRPGSVVTVTDSAVSNGQEGVGSDVVTIVDAAVSVRRNVGATVVTVVDDYSAIGPPQIGVTAVTVTDGAVAVHGPQRGATVVQIFDAAVAIDNNAPNLRFYVANVENSAFSEYGYPFDSMCVFEQGEEYGVDENGLYLIGADDFNGSAINAEIVPPLDDYGNANLKAMNNLIAEMRTDGDMVLKLRAMVDGRLDEHWYQFQGPTGADELTQYLAEPGLGLEARRFQPVIANIGGADFEIERLDQYFEDLDRRF